MSNQLTTLPQLKNMLSGEATKKRFQEILGQKAPGFISSILSVANSNSLLQKAEPMSVMNAAVIAATLDLPINPTLGMAAIVPYGNQAQFQIMTKGLTELSLRSGQFISLINEIVYEGQLISKNKFTGEYVFDEDLKKSDKVIGYMAYYKLTNGFEKTMYMTIEEIQAHAGKFSQTYKRNQGVWKDNFDAMGLKTVLKLLLSKYAPKSIEMQRAITFDQATVKDNLIERDIEEVTPDYVDNENNSSVVDIPHEEITPEDQENYYAECQFNPELAPEYFAQGKISKEQFDQVNKLLGKK